MLLSRYLVVLSREFDVTVFYIPVWLAAILMRKFCVPYERGFFKDDESIMHPFHGSTIPSSTLYAVGFTIPVITVGLPSFLF